METSETRGAGKAASSTPRRKLSEMSPEERKALFKRVHQEVVQEIAEEDAFHMWLEESVNQGLARLTPEQTADLLRGLAHPGPQPALRLEQPTDEDRV